MQELIVIDDLLSTFVGIEGRYISIKKVRGKEDAITFQVDASMDLALQVHNFVFSFKFFVSILNLFIGKRTLVVDWYEIMIQIVALYLVQFQGVRSDLLENPCESLTEQDTSGECEE